MNKNRLLLVVALTLGLIFALGAPIKFESVSFFKSKNKTFQLEPVLKSDGSATVTLKGLKASDVPLVNIHTTENLYSADLKSATSVDFGALEALAADNPIFNGDSISLKEGSEVNFKVLSASKDKSSVAAIINSSSLLVPIKPLKVKDLNKLSDGDFTSAISELSPFITGQNCYNTLQEGDKLIERCPEFIYSSPYKLDYSPKTQLLNITPTDSELWEKFSVYDSQIAFSYGKAPNLKYDKKDYVPAIKLSANLRYAVSEIGNFTLGASNQMPAARALIGISDGSYSSPGSVTPTATSTPSATATHTRTPVVVPTKTSTPRPTATSTRTPTVEPTKTRTPVPTATRTRTPTVTPTKTRTPWPTATPISYMACVCQGKNGLGNHVWAPHIPPKTEKGCEEFCPRPKDVWCQKTDGLGTRFVVRNCKWKLWVER